MNILLMHKLVAFASILLFGLLAATCFFVHFPKDAGLESYRRSRRMLGLAMAIMALYCAIRLSFPQNHEEFADFSLLVIFAFVFSWLTYASFLFMVETPRYTMRRFIIDGIIPLTIFSILGLVGIFIPKIQIYLSWIFGTLYMVKILWMYSICIKEYNACKIEITNYSDVNIDILWMKVFLTIALLLSFSAVTAFYLPQKYLDIYIIIPVVYSYLTFKVINFASVKIDNLKHKKPVINIIATPPHKTKDVSDKLEPMIEKWVAEKKFCREGISIKDTASEMGTNQTYLSSYLNNNLGITFQVWLNTLRIEESKILMASKEKLSIEEIGRMVGIPQNYNFSRWFKIITDTTPFQYRRKIQSES